MSRVPDLGVYQDNATSNDTPTRRHGKSGTVWHNNTTITCTCAEKHFQLEGVSYQGLPRAGITMMMVTSSPTCSPCHPFQYSRKRRHEKKDGKRTRTREELCHRLVKQHTGWSTHWMVNNAQVLSVPHQLFLATVNTTVNNHHQQQRRVHAHIRSITAAAANTHQLAHIPYKTHQQHITGTKERGRKTHDESSDTAMVPHQNATHVAAHKTATLFD